MANYKYPFTTANKVPTVQERRKYLFALEKLPLEERRAVLGKYYDDWVHNGYEEHCIRNGYVGHITLAEEIHARIPDTSKRILDCASGNGFLGEQLLKKHGFTNLDALDMSQGCLDYTRGKNVYTNYICAALGPDRLPIDDDAYDGIGLTAGCGAGHVQPDCLPEWIRITKPGGLIMFVVQEKYLDGEHYDENYCNGALDAILHKMAAEGQVEFLEKKRLFYLKNQTDKSKNEYSYMFVLRVM
ncbi:uncharacterized protein LOC117292770 [Asterias rubens]|uniref:uncharacterized protein LOC117292770 n=1 Tax=Asterias rubens TaxID=7604 RepID=UPI001455CA6B|nr:uncharacterized protein LOC117292770 [Asterias rubens]XP_033630810.1 uncharacterized protein LOC117292770 [Asterias rubens]